MNFDFTKIKGLTTLIVSMIGGIYIAAQKSGLTSCFNCTASEQLENLLFGFTVGFLVICIPIYFIWSFFDKGVSSRTGKYVGRLLAIIFSIIIAIIIIAVIAFFIMYFAPLIILIFQHH